jgi:hypothetical protein
MVMGIIGYTQGVSEVRKPAVKAKTKALKVPRLAASEKPPAACARPGTSTLDAQPNPRSLPI